jgi:hypothetical protein
VDSEECEQSVLREQLELELAEERRACLAEVREAQRAQRAEKQMQLAQEKLAAEEAEASRLAAERLEAVLAEEARKAEELARLRDCNVCGDSKEPLEYSTKPPTSRCAHEITTCNECLQSWMASEFETKGTEGIKCPECPEIFEYDDVQRAASAHTFAAYDKMATRNALSALDDFAWCLAPGCDNGQLNPENNNFMDCAACGYKQCLRHKVKYALHCWIGGDESILIATQMACQRDMRAIRIPHFRPKGERRRAQDRSYARRHHEEVSKQIVRMAYREARRLRAYDLPQVQARGERYRKLPCCNWRTDWSTVLLAMPSVAKRDPSRRQYGSSELVQVPLERARCRMAIQCALSEEINLQSWPSGLGMATTRMMAIATVPWTSNEKDLINQTALLRGTGY